MYKVKREIKERRAVDLGGERKTLYWLGILLLSLDISLSGHHLKLPEVVNVYLELDLNHSRKNQAGHLKLGMPFYKFNVCIKSPYQKFDMDENIYNQLSLFPMN